MAIIKDTIVFGAKTTAILDKTIIGVVVNVGFGFTMGIPGSFNRYSVWNPRTNITFNNCIWNRDPFLITLRNYPGTTINFDYYIENAQTVIDIWINSLKLAVTRLNNLKIQAQGLGIYV